MSSLHISCPSCGSPNDLGMEHCHLCEHPLHSETATKSRKPLGISSSRREHWKLSRRTALWEIAGGAIVLSALGAAGYLTYQKSLDPHILTYADDTDSAAWSPNGTRVASVTWSSGETPPPPPSPQSGNVVVQVWDAITGQRLLICRLEHAGTGVAPAGVVWSADGKQLVAFVKDQGIGTPGSRIVDFVQVWDAATGQRLRRLPVIPPVTLTQQGYWDPDQPLVGAWALNEEYLALVKEGGKSTNGKFYKEIEIWDIVTGRKVSTLDLEDQMVQHLIWASESGKLAVSGDKLCQIWDAPAGKKLHVFPAHSVVAWSLDGGSIAVGNAIYDVQTGRKVAAYRVEGRVTAQAWSPDGKHLAVSSFSSKTRPYGPVYGTISLIDVSSGRQLAQYDEGQIDPVAEVRAGTGGEMAWSPNGKDLLVVRREINIWRVG